jgi:long-chain acyl-CoA synthetase
VVENQELLERVLEVEDDLELEFVVSIDSLKGYDERDDIYTLDEVYSLGREAYDAEALDSWLEDLESDDLATLIYTSGTTGQPKGVRITHRNFRSCLNQMWKRLGPRPDKPDEMVTLNDDLRVLSFLPLAHAFERFAHLAMVTAGAAIGYAEDVEPEVLREDMRKVQPVGIATVPRLLEKIYDAVLEQTSGSAVKSRIFEWSVDVGEEYWEFYEKGEEPTGIEYYSREPPLPLRSKYAVADRLVYSKVRENLGGSIEAFLSAGGSLPEHLARAYLGMGLPLFEGYGMTEASPVVSIVPPEHPKVGTLGPPLCNVEVKVDESRVGTSVLEDTEGKEVGELMVRGPNVFDGYWEMPDRTDEAFEKAEDDGYDWFRTGDVVSIDEDGYLSFVDRVKNLVVLSTGKNVPAEPIEDAAVESEYIDQCMVVGDERKYVGALVVPNLDRIREWATEKRYSLPTKNEGLLEDDRVYGLVEGEIEKANHGFEEYEQIKDFVLIADEWTEENGFMTPTMKKKRHEISEEYADEIESIYEGV